MKHRLYPIWRGNLIDRDPGSQAKCDCDEDWGGGVKGYHCPRHDPTAYAQESAQHRTDAA